ncbi:CsbD family protein [Luteolibacter algae]|uniref:CsbD family protein n=1 Tax=Luteolibacter algae TaxID=454151 RepID=A0ABW5D9A4_9BACT
MNQLQIKGGWDQAKGRLKQNYAELTDDDLLYAEGKENELIGKLKTKLGKSEEEIRKIIEG